MPHTQLPWPLTINTIVDRIESYDRCVFGLGILYFCFRSLPHLLLFVFKRCERTKSILFISYGKTLITIHTKKRFHPYNGQRKYDSISALQFVFSSLLHIFSLVVSVVVVGVVL